MREGGRRGREEQGREERGMEARGGRRLEEVQSSQKTVGEQVRGAGEEAGRER